MQGRNVSVPKPIKYIFIFYIIDPLNIQRPFGIVRHLGERGKKRD